MTGAGFLGRLGARLPAHICSCCSILLRQALKPPDRPERQGEVSEFTRHHPEIRRVKSQGNGANNTGNNIQPVEPREMIPHDPRTPTGRPGEETMENKRETGWYGNDMKKSDIWSRKTLDGIQNCYCRNVQHEESRELPNSRSLTSQHRTRLLHKGSLCSFYSSCFMRNTWAFTLTTCVCLEVHYSPHAQHSEYLCCVLCACLTWSTYLERIAMPVPSLTSPRSSQMGWPR